MSIKAIESIPAQQAKKNFRQMIEADVTEAIEKGITIFEFTGDYNYKNLAPYAREVVSRMLRKRIIDIQKRFKEEYFTDDEKFIKGFHVWFKSTYEYKNEWIIIISRKENDRIRVFCTINDFDSLEKKIIEDCKQALNKERKECEFVDGKWKRNP